MLIRFDPFRELDRFAHELRAASDAPGRIPMDAVRRGDHVELLFELPGVDPASIDVELEKRSLSVTAERHVPVEAHDDEQVLVRERRAGRFARQITLGDHLDPDRLEAHYDAGVLTLRIPVAEQAKTRKVQVHAGPVPPPIEATTAEASAAVDPVAA